MYFELCSPRVGCRGRMWWVSNKHLPMLQWMSLWMAPCLSKHDGSWNIYMKDVHLITVIWNSDWRNCDYLWIFQSAQFYFWPGCCVDRGMWSALICVCEGVQRTMPYCVLSCFAFYLLEMMEKCLQNLSSTCQTILSSPELGSKPCFSYLMPPSFWKIQKHVSY